jgi:hypothetical protein
MSHNLLKNNKIPHLILNENIDDLKSYIPNENLLNISWGKLSIKYPDDLKTLHMSHEGHKIVYETILTKLSSNLI